MFSKAWSFVILLPILLTHWGRVTHICVGKLTTIGSDNVLSPGRCQAIIWTSDGILLIRTLGTNFSEILSEIHSFSFTKTHLKMSSAKWRLSRRNVLSLPLCGNRMLSKPCENTKSATYAKLSLLRFYVYSAGLFRTTAAFDSHGLTLIPAWISNHMLSSVWEAITSLFINLKSCTVEV